MELPDSAIQLLVLFASSNTDLASLSNVCRKWREITTKSILDLSRNSLQTGDEEGPTSLLLVASMVRYLMSNEKDTNNDLESYCLAWFTPSGIRFKSLHIDPRDNSDLEDQVQTRIDYQNEDPPQGFAPAGELPYAGSEDEKMNSRRQPSRSATPTVNSLSARLQRAGSPNTVNCLYQWDGLRNPEDVLAPFGYAHVFLKNLLALARSSQDMVIDVPKGKAPSKMEQSTLLQTKTSFAVRGATVARPEGYCLCWEVDDLTLLMSNRANRNENPMLNVRQQELDLLTKRRLRRKRELQREVLPKVLNCAPRAANGRPQLGIQQPCVQFLNLDSSHAVRLFTPPFQPSPVPTPITVFCVGIATEDGCFMSGLKRPFELGHLYPETPRDDMIERSPICLFTEAVNTGLVVDTTQKREEDTDEKDASFNSDDSSCDMSMEAARGDPGFKCACPFSGLGDIIDEDHEHEPVGNVCRGNLGPGCWHCYVAVFDGVESRIRIDGLPESVRCNFNTSSGATAFLDGLTIGADHAFDMSLCFGQGSDGEGEGAIAELAVFKGKFDDRDIEVMEQRLMTKYGIPSPNLPESERTEEDRYYRLAHALLSHPPGHKLLQRTHDRIPLRYMTKHRMVSWRQTNPVTGEPVRVQRIGSKFGESSSDW